MNRSIFKLAEEFYRYERNFWRWVKYFQTQLIALQGGFSYGSEAVIVKGDQMRKIRANTKLEVKMNRYRSVFLVILMFILISCQSTSPSAGDVSPFTSYPPSQSPKQSEFYVISRQALGRDLGTQASLSQSFGEIGVVEASQANRSDRHLVTLENTFVDPVVIAQPASFNDGDPVFVTITNVGNDSFEFFLEEPNYLDGAHGLETISYLVVENGMWGRTNGLLFEAGWLDNIGSEFLSSNIPYAIRRNEVPALFAQAQTNNDPDPTVIRQKTGSFGFNFKIQKEEALDTNPATMYVPERVGYIAIKTGSGIFGDTTLEVGLTPKEVTHNFYALSLAVPAEKQAHGIIANMQLFQGGDTSWLRFQENGGFELRVEEESSRDAETNHNSVQVAYMAVFGPPIPNDFELISIDSNGIPGNSSSINPIISADGRFVAFGTNSINLLENDLNSTTRDVIIFDRQTNLNELISLSSIGIQANGISGTPSMTPDGRYIVFTSYADNLVPNDLNGMGDVFIRDRELGTTERVSFDLTGLEFSTHSGNQIQAVSDDGRYVAFHSQSPSQIFVRDRLLETTEIVSVNNDGIMGDRGSIAAAISGSGDFVVFESGSTNLTSEDISNDSDIFLHDRVAGTTEWIDQDANGNNGGNSFSQRARISRDGRFVTFHSNNALTANDTDSVGTDVYLRDRLLDTITLVSKSLDGNSGNFTSFEPAISADGEFIFFASGASDLVSDDTNEKTDLFLYTIATQSIERITVSATGEQADDLSTNPNISPNGQFLVFSSQANTLIPSIDSNARQVYFLEK